MGTCSSRMESAPFERPSRRQRQRQRRRSSIKRIVSSIILCGSSRPSSSLREVDDNPAELLVNSAELVHRDKSNPTRKHYDLPVGNNSIDVVHIRTENEVSSGRCIVVNPSLVVPTNNVWRKFLIENRDVIPSRQSLSSVGSIETASTSYTAPPSPGCVCSTEITDLDAGNDINDSITGGSYQIDEALSNSSIFGRHVHGSVNLSSVECGSASLVSDSLTEFNFLMDDSTQVVRPSSSRSLVSEREDNRDHQNIMPGHVMDDVSSNFSSSHYAETSTHGTRRNSRRLFWDNLVRRNSRRDADSRNFSSSSHNLDHVIRSNNRVRDSRGVLLCNEDRGDIRFQGGNELQWNSRTEILERHRGSGDSVDPEASACSRGIHVDGLCSCLSGSSSEQYTPHAGISGVALLAEALFEVLDQIYRQPPLLSMSMTSVPAPESVVDSFAVRIHRKPEISECANDVPQCYICLDEYEEGDNIRILPCHHEYHMSCVDKWLKEVHGVCPLCRSDVCECHTETSASNEETP